MKGRQSAKSGVGRLQAWTVCLSAGLFFFYEFFQLNSFDVLNHLIRSHYGLQASQMSVLSSVFMWANMLFLIPAGVVLDHYSVRRVLLVAMLVCLIGVSCIAGGEDLWMLLLGRFLTGVGNSACFLSCVILVSRWFHKSQQGLVMGLMVTLAFVGGMIAHMPFVYLIQSVGWRAALGVDVAMGGLIWALIYLFVKAWPVGNEPVKTPHRDGLLVSFLAVLRVPQTYLAGCYTSFLNLPIMVLCALWGASYLEVVHGVSTLQASQIVSMLFFGSMVGCPLLGWISDRQGKRKPMMWLGVVGAWACLAPFWIATDLSVMQLSFIFWGLGFFTSAQVISYPLLAESHPPARVGEATGVASVIIMGGGALGQLLFGMLIQHHAGVASLDYSAEHFHYAMGMFPLAVLLAAVALRWIQEPKHEGKV